MITFKEVANRLYGIVIELSIILYFLTSFYTVLRKNKFAHYLFVLLCLVLIGFSAILRDEIEYALLVIILTSIAVALRIVVIIWVLPSKNEQHRLTEDRGGSFWQQFFSEVMDMFKWPDVLYFLIILLFLLTVFLLCH